MASNSSNSSIVIIGNGTSALSFSGASISDFIQIVFFSLTIIIAFFYTALILIRRTFRSNKINWLTVNICIMSALLSNAMVMMTVKRFFNIFNILPCRLEAYFVVMTVCQMMYSHGVAAFSRYVTIVYSTKPIFRSTKCLWSSICSGWFISILVALPYLFLDDFTCSNSTPVIFLPYYNLVSMFILPIMIVGICNSHVLLYVRRSSRQVHAANSTGRVSHARDTHLLKVMIGTFTIFSVGWAPLILTQTFNKNNTIPVVLDNCIQILPSLTMFFDVIFLMYTNEPVRLLLKQSLIQCLQKKN